MNLRDMREMTQEERDAAWETLITCDGKGKDAKREALRNLIYWNRHDAIHWYKHEPPDENR